MNEIKIIGHRGADGLITGNTIKSIKHAVSLGVDAIEFDVWTTKDGVPVLAHSSSLILKNGQRKQVFKLRHKEVQQVELPGGYGIPTMAEALLAAGKTPVLVDIKDFYLSKNVLATLNKFKSSDISISSFNHHVLLELQAKKPGLKLYATTNFHALHTVRFAAQHHLAGIVMDWKAFSLPLYWYARYKKLEITLFTVNNPIFMKFLKLFKVRARITTNYPDRAQKVLR